jgi:membrane protease subunit HflC
MKAVKFIIPAIVLIAVVIFQSLFIVQEISQAIVLQFGDPKKIISKAGLNFKLPFIQNVVFLDKRILNLDNEPQEVIAADQKRLIVDAIARFKIVDPLKFYISTLCCKWALPSIARRARCSFKIWKICQHNSARIALSFTNAC